MTTTKRIPRSYLEMLVIHVQQQQRDLRLIKSSPTIVTQQAVDDMEQLITLNQQYLEAIRLAMLSYSGAEINKAADQCI